MVTKKKAVKKVAAKKEPKIDVLEFNKSNIKDIREGILLKDNSIDEVALNRVIEYLTAQERIAFMNELHRVLKPEGKVSILCPNWASNRSYADLDAQWPPISEGWFFFLSADWRKQNVPDENKYTCDFEPTWGYGMHPLIQSRNQEYQQHAIMFWKEAAQDISVTLKKK